MTILAQDFPFNSINKQMMTKEINFYQISDGLLLIRDCFPGDVFVVNSGNKVINIPQIQYHIDGVCKGVYLDFKNYEKNDLQGWKIKFFNIKNVTSTIEIDDNSLQELMKLSLIFN